MQWSPIGLGDANRFTTVETSQAEYNASVGEFVKSTGQEVVLPEPTENGIVVVRNVGPQLRVSAASGLVHTDSSFRRLDNKEPVYLVSDGVNWYSLSGTDGFLPAIPDSVELRYEATEVSGGDAVWNDLNKVADMSLTGDETDSTLSDGSEALAFDADAGDHGTFEMPTSLENAGQQTFSVEFALQYTESSQTYLTGCRPAGDNRTMRFRANTTAEGEEESGNMRFLYTDDSVNQLAFDFENNPNLNDGERHDITYIFHDISQHDVTVIVDGTERDINITRSDNPTDFFDYGDEDWVFAGFNDEGTIRPELSLDAGAMYWYTDAIDQQYISNY